MVFFHSYVKSQLIFLGAARAPIFKHSRPGTPLGTPLPFGIGSFGQIYIRHMIGI